MLERDLCSNAKKMGQRLREHLEALRKHGIVGDIRGKGLFLGVEWVANPTTKEQFSPPLGTAIGRRALDLGLLTRFDPHWLAVGPPLTINADQIDEIGQILDQAVGQCLAERGSQHN
jgi:4-aminobutyrate aminotransferase-like enzyme